MVLDFLKKHKGKVAAAVSAAVLALLADNVTGSSVLNAVLKSLGF